MELHVLDLQRGIESKCTVFMLEVMQEYNRSIGKETLNC